MIGYINAQIQIPGSVDDDGIPIPGSTSWGEDIECQYIALLQNNKGRTNDGGEFKQSSFEITTSEMDFFAKTIRLKDRLKREVCVKEVQSLEELYSVQRIKITV